MNRSRRRHLRGEEGSINGERNQFSGSQRRALREEEIRREEHRIIPIVERTIMIGNGGRVGENPKIHMWMLYLLAVNVASEFPQLDRKTPVTAGLIAANILVYMRPGVLNDLLPSLCDVCLQPYLVIQNRDLKRLFLSAFYHVDESHLMYNILSLLWKGVQLERMMGSTKYATMVAMLLGLSHGIAVILAKVLETFFDYPYTLTSYCAVGFSSVLFALKVVLNSNSSILTNGYGMLLPTRYAAWVELLLIQMIVPKVSFLGNLSGIFAGLLYIWLRRFFSGSDPLSLIIRKLTWILGWPRRFFQDHFNGFRRRNFGHGTASVSQDMPDPTALAGVSQDMRLEEPQRRRLERFCR